MSEEESQSYSNENDDDEERERSRSSKTLKFQVKSTKSLKNDHPPTIDGNDREQLRPTKLVETNALQTIEQRIVTKLVIEFSGINLILRQPFKILTDIWGVLTSYRFRHTLFDYIDENLSTYLIANVKTAAIKHYIEELRLKTQQDRSNHPKMPRLIFDRTDLDLVNSIVANLQYRRNHSDKNLMNFFDTIYNSVWNEGYAKKALRPHVFPDVIPNFRKWHSDPFFIKIYTFASGPLEIQRLFLSSSIEGNVSEWITSGFDTHNRYKYETSKFRSVIASLGEREAKNLFYLTDSPKKGLAARRSGISVFLVLRPDNRQYRFDDLKSFPTINSFDEFIFHQFGGCC
ncbi:RNA binding protein fox-1 2 [Sarcoptes scabiei]|nr:RNA binding protein fox-1 2 [Sarcoptes scabiei]